MELLDKVVVITGGANGIGRAGALALAAAGCDVVIADVDDKAAAQTAADVQALGRRCLYVRSDVTDDAQMQALAQESLKTFGQVDIVWNHAGASVAGPPERIPVERWRHLLDLNVLGGVRGLLNFLPDMLARGSGHVVFTTSGLGLFPDAIAGLAAPYVTTKAAQIGLARTLAPYLAERGVGVSLLAPHITNTRHTFESPLIDLDPEVVAANLDLDAMQQPGAVAALLVDGLRTDQFLISAVPDTRKLLVAAAARLYAMPGDDTQPVVQYVRIQADPERHDELAAILAQSAKATAAEPGAIEVRVGADLTHPGLFHLFEEWRSGDDLDHHAGTPDAQAMLRRMPEFGIDSLEVRRYGVETVAADHVSPEPHEQHKHRQSAPSGSDERVHSGRSNTSHEG